MLNNYPDVLKPKEVREIFGISRPTFIKWIKNGRLREIIISDRGDRRFLKKDILELLK